MKRICFLAVVVSVAAFIWWSTRPSSSAARQDPAPSGRIAAFSGQVRNAQGRALSSAAVHPVWIGTDADPRALEAAPVDADGAWRLDVPLPAESGVLLLVATAPGYETVGRRVDPAERRQDFVLASGGARVTVQVKTGAGNAVQGATVLLSIEPEAGEPQAALVLSGATDRSGEVSFEAVAGAAAQLHWTARAKGQGMASGTRRKDWGHAPVLIDAVLRKGVTLSGVAFSERSPVAGITVAVRQAAGAWGEKARTGSAGEFAIAEVPAGEPLELEVLSDEQMLADGQDVLAFNIPLDAEAHKLQLQLQPAGVVTGVVTARSGRPLGGASIEAIPADHRMTTRRAATTTADGRFRLGGLRADTAWTVQASHPDFAPQFVDDVRPSRSGTPVTLSLVQGGAVAGAVQYDDGQPAEGIEVYIHRIEESGTVVTGLREHGTVTTNSEGRFRFDHLSPGAARIEVRSPARMGWSPIAARVLQARIEEGQTTWLDPVALPRPGVLYAELVTDVLDPAETMAEVSFMRTGARGAPHTVRAQRAPDGSVRIGDLESGDYEVSFRLANHGTAQAPARIRAGEVTSLRLEFDDGVALSGMLRHADGTPAVDALVEAYLPETRSQKAYPMGGRAPDNLSGNQTRTDADGMFRIPGLQPRQYTLRARHPQEAPLERRIDVVAGRNPIELRFPPAAGCEVRLVDDREQPLPDKVVVLQSSGEGRHTTSGVTDAKGVAHFPRLPAGTYRARAVVSGQPTTECEASPGRVSAVTVRSTSI